MCIRDSLSYSRISSTAQYEEEVKDIGVQVRVHVVPAASGDGRRVQVDVMLQAPKIPFTEGGGRHVASVQVVTFYGDGHGRFLGESWQQLDLNLREETWQKVQKDGIPFSTRVPYQVPDQTFKIVVYSYDADKIGSVTTRLR